MDLMSAGSDLYHSGVLPAESEEMTSDSKAGALVAARERADGGSAVRRTLIMEACTSSGTLAWALTPMAKAAVKARVLNCIVVDVWRIPRCTGC